MKASLFVKKDSQKKKSLTVVAIASLAMCICAQTEYFVDCTRPDDSGDGLTEATAKRTIQAAVDLTNPAGKDIVTVLPGVYDEGTRISPAFSDHEFRVVITNQILLRSRDGAENTIIKGGFGSGANKLGPGAVRGIYMRGPAYSAIEGFTITGCATTNTAASGERHFGAAVVGSWNQYVLGCVISNNHAVGGAGIYNCTVARSLLAHNKAESSSVGYLGWYWNCVIANNEGPNPLYNTRIMSNCTCVNNAGQIGGRSSGYAWDQYFHNSVIMGNGGGDGYPNCTCLTNSVVQSAETAFKGVSGSVVGASHLQFVAPVCGDWRLVEGSDATGIADWNRYYTLVSSDQKLTVAVDGGCLPRYIEEEYVYMDFAGNPISADKPMDAGAIQGTVEIESGRLVFITPGFHSETGVPLLNNNYAYAHAEKWPSILVCKRTLANGTKTFGCRVSGGYVSSSRSYKFADIKDRFDFALPSLSSLPSSST